MSSGTNQPRDHHRAASHSIVEEARSPGTGASTEVRRFKLTGRRGALSAFLYAVPIGLVGGLIGLGGAEFRLPVLAGPLGYAVRRAVPLNLAVSLVTLITALAVRGQTLSLATITPFMTTIVAMTSGAVITAFVGTALVGHLSNERLEQVILVLLVLIGCALIVEAFLPQSLPALVPNALAWRLTLGFLFGLVIGLFSSLLGVAGGELIIPTLVFAFGADIKTAGTASLLISLPTVSVGVIRYAVRGAFSEKLGMVETVAPMGIGSIIGAFAGALLVGVLSPSALKIGLGVILIASAVRIFHKAD